MCRNAMKVADCAKRCLHPSGGKGSFCSVFIWLGQNDKCESTLTSEKSSPFLDWTAILDTLKVIFSRYLKVTEFIY